ncbi:MAG: hypothetical protein HZB55_05110 [Deltaproteobacteria bacterium]|nr:hypothetical protein [Deltaproteobacteria bacterium]
MVPTASLFGALPNDETRPMVIRTLRVALQAELLRAGSLWEESLAVLREAASHRRHLPSAKAALAWYRSADHPNV